MYTLGQLADLLDARLVGDAGCPISGIATINQAKSGEITFLSNPIYRKYLTTTQASAVIINEGDAAACGTNALVMSNPYFGYAKLSHFFVKATLSKKQTIHPTAVISDNVSIDLSAQIGPYCVIESNVTIKKNVVIGAHCSIGQDCIIGEGSLLQANVTLYSGISLGQKAIIHSGAVIGADGFGFVPVSQEENSWYKIAQLGNVKIGNNVEIGANTTIDRGALDDTIIDDNVKLDNQIQLGHNVEIGEGTAIAGCVGVAGSTKIGRYCTIGGGVGIGGHLDITDHVHITGMTMVTKSIKHPGVYSSGIAINTNVKWRKNAARFYQLDDLARRLIAVEKKIKEE